MASSDVNRLIDMLYERIEEAKAPALKPGMSIVDRDEMLDLLDELRAQLPVEVKRAQELLSAREKFVEEAFYFLHIIHIILKTYQSAYTV